PVKKGVRSAKVVREKRKPQKARDTGSRDPPAAPAPHSPKLLGAPADGSRATGRSRAAQSGQVLWRPAEATPSGGARGGSGGGGDRTDDRPTDCAGGAGRARAAGVRASQANEVQPGLLGPAHHRRCGQLHDRQRMMTNECAGRLVLGIAPPAGAGRRRWDGMTDRRPANCR
ncbi:hypothetical protein P7K49_033717, partial [Saguinus oedipus]